MDDELEKIIERKKTELLRKISGHGVPRQQKYPSKPITITDSTFRQVVKQYPLLLIDFWAPWCAPCQITDPIINEMARDYAGRIVLGN